MVEHTMRRYLKLLEENEQLTEQSNYWTQKAHELEKSLQYLAMTYPNDLHDTEENQEEIEEYVNKTMQRYVDHEDTEMLGSPQEQWKELAYAFEEVYDMDPWHYVRMIWDEYNE